MARNLVNVFPFNLFCARVVSFIVALFCPLGYSIAIDFDGVEKYF